MTKIKICGITSLADARYASGAGADYLGFIQHPGSARFIEPELAREMIQWVHGASPVGVFVNMDAESVNKICDRAGFDFAQLHGDETPAYCEWIDRPIIKAIRVSPNTTSTDLQLAMNAYAHVAEFLLLDTAAGASFGGTGTAFDWNILSGVKAPLPLFIAGGLSPDNVGKAIEVIQPFAVDVATGVEMKPLQGSFLEPGTDVKPGEKDFTKIDTFIASVRGAGQ